MSKPVGVVLYATEESAIRISRFAVLCHQFFPHVCLTFWHLVAVHIWNLGIVDRQTHQNSPKTPHRTHQNLIFTIDFAPNPCYNC